MDLTSYLQIDGICLILLLGMVRVSDKRHGTFSLTSLAFLRMIYMAIVMCLADCVAGILDGTTIQGARLLLEVSNIVYIGSSAYLGFIWMTYVNLRLKGYTVNHKKRMFIWFTPLFIFLLALFTNPFSHLFFTLDETNTYSRGDFIILHWIVSWFYLLAPTAQILYALCKTDNHLQRREMYPLLTFVLLPILCAVLQMIFYGLNTLQVGIILSMVMVMVSQLVAQVSHDELTGLNNRHDLDRYVTDLATRKKRITVFMCDVNDFKRINDNYGHLYGDEALCDVAGALRRCCMRHPSHPFLCRYGGDEFVLVSVEQDEASTQSFREMLEEEVKHAADSTAKPYQLSMSVGTATGICGSWSQMEQLLSEADKTMYKSKDNFKARH